MVDFGFLFPQFVCRRVLTSGFGARTIVHCCLTFVRVLSLPASVFLAFAGASAQAEPAYYDHHRLGRGEVQRPCRRVSGLPQDQRWNDVKALPAALLQGTRE